MDLGDLLTYVRQQYNAVGDDFFSDQELYRLVWAAQMRLAKEALCIEATFTTPTVASQQEYSYPSNMIAIKRVTWDGVKLMPITLRQDDSLTLFNSSTTVTGSPQYYFVWDRVLSLRPIPATVADIKIYAYCMPQEVTSTSSLEVPEEFHLDIADFMLWKMAAKDKNFEAAAHYRDLWENPRDGHVAKAKKWSKKRLRGDAFVYVMDEEQMTQTYIGSY